MKITIKRFKKALTGTAGVYASIAQNLDADRSTVSKYLLRHPEMMQFVEQEREKMIDLAENKLFKKINNGEWLPTQFFLKTKGKDRGYVEKHEVEHSGEIDNKLEVIFVGNENEQDSNEDTVKQH